MSTHSMTRGGAGSWSAAASSARPCWASSRRIDGVLRTKCALVISRRAAIVSLRRAAFAKSSFRAAACMASASSAITAGRSPRRNAHASSKRARYSAAPILPRQGAVQKRMTSARQCVWASASGVKASQLRRP